MDQLAFLFGSAFVVGFSGAMMPGPVLTATISEVLKRGWIAGPLIVLGHGLLELLILAAVVAGLGAWIQQEAVLAVLGVAGGIALLTIGIHMAATAERAAKQVANTEEDPRTAIRGPVVTGMLTSISTPYFPLWWATIGLGYAALALKSGIPGLISFYSGHILSDLTWYTFVALAVASGRRFCSPSVHRRLIVICGLILMGLGFYFLSTGMAHMV